MEKGFDAAYEDFKALYGKRANFDLAYHHARSLFLTAVTIYFAKLFYDKREEEQQKAGEKFVQETTEKIQEIADRNKAAAPLEDELLKNWKQSFSPGKAPSAEDEALIKRVLYGDNAPGLTRPAPGHGSH